MGGAEDPAELGGGEGGNGVVALEPGAGAVAGGQRGGGYVGGSATAAEALIAHGQQDDGYGEWGGPYGIGEGDAVFAGEPFDGGEA